MFDKDLFLSICEKYDVEFSQTADSPMLREGRTMKREIIVETNDDFESCDDCVHSEIWKEINRLKAIAEYQNFLSRISYKYEWELGVDVYRIISNELHIYINERSSGRIELIGFPVRINYEDRTIIKLWKEVGQ